MTTAPNSVGDRLAALAAADPDRRLVSIGDRWVSAKQLDERTNRLAAGLAALGVAHSDRVATVLPNCLPAVETIFACAKLGAIVVPLNAYLKGEFLRYQLSDSAPAVLIGDASAVSAVSSLRSGVPELKALVSVDRSEMPGARTDLRYDVEYEDLLASASDRPAERVRIADALAILYTSGTTGMPKGCVLSHGYVMHPARSHYHFGHTREHDIIFTALPLFHGAAFGSLMDTIGGVPCSVSFEPAFSASTFLASAAERGATVIRGVGAMAVTLLECPAGPADREHAIQRAHFFPVTAAIRQSFEQRFGIAMLAGGYGQTECNPAVHLPYEERSQVTAGKALPWIDLRIVDDDDVQVPAGEVGEIVLRNKEPYGLFSGYWGNPQATVDSFRNLWHHTGDFGSVDAEDYLTFVDRKKDALRRRGENISSFELERAIVAHPQVRQAAVHSVASPFTEDDIKVCLVLHDGLEVTPQELFGYFADHLPYYAMPRYVEICDELPVNAVSRVQKHVLRERGNGPNTWDFEKLGLAVNRDDRR